MWISRHVDEAGKLWGIVMAGECPWCVLRVVVASQRHAHGMELDSGKLLPVCVPAASLGVEG